MCQLLPWVQGVSVFICTFSLSAIAIDRYILVVHPHTHPLNRRSAFYTAGILWAASVVRIIVYIDIQHKIMNESFGYWTSTGLIYIDSVEQ